MSSAFLGSYDFRLDAPEPDETDIGAPPPTPEEAEEAWLDQCISDADERRKTAFAEAQRVQDRLGGRIAAFGWTSSGQLCSVSFTMDCGCRVGVCVQKGGPSYSWSEARDCKGGKGHVDTGIRP